MGDVAQILGQTILSSSSTELPPIVPTFTSGGFTSSVKPQHQHPPEKDTADASDGDVAAAESAAALATTAKHIKVGNKFISSAKRARKWAWAPFTSSSRTDGLELHHWVRAGVDYVEYPFARFDIHLDPVTYTMEEYRQYLQSDTWTQSETSYLMELARIYELRWPVIHDRWYDKFDYSAVAEIDDDANADLAAIKIDKDKDNNNNNNNSIAATRRIEDLQHRYYEVAAKLAQVRISQEAANEVQQLQAATTAAAQAAAAAASAAAQAAAAAAAAAASAASAVSSASGPDGAQLGTSGSTAQAPKSTPASAQAVSAPETAPVPVGGGPSTVDPTLTLPPGVDEKTEALLLETAAARAMATAPATQPLMNFIGTGSTNKMFDVTHERKRRNQLDRMWKRSKDEEEEEMELRKELREVEAQLRKLKKSGGHILAAAGIRGTPAGGGSAGGNVTGLGGGTANPPPSASSSRNPSRSVSPMPGGGTGAFFSSKLNSTDGTTEVGHDVLDKIFASTAPVPMPGYPYLQSGRLVPPAAGGDAGINKSLLTQMDQVLNELNIKDRPLPTKQVCDTYDSVRKDILTLLTLQKIVMQKEGQLQAKQVQLAKLTKAAQPPSTATSTTGEAGTNNTDLLDEEGLLGIPPPDQAPAPTTAKTQKSKPVKKKAPAAGTIGNAAVGSSKKGTKKTPDDANAAAGNKSGEGATATKKKPVKRKRKSEAKTQPPPGGPTPSVAKSAGQGKKSSVSTPIASDPIALAAQAAAAAASAVAGLDVAKAADIAVSAATTPSSGNAKKRARKS